MKKLKQITNQIKELSPEQSGELETLLWPYICYSPKMPLRFAQEQLLQEAEKVSLTVTDEYYTGTELSFNTFKWGSGTHKVLLTHGWGSKAGDLSEIITALTAIPNLQVIAFDASGNGSSEGDLSSLLLFAEAVKAIANFYGNPDILIGHSLGAMANVLAIGQMQITPTLVVSITPLVKLKENFEASMDALAIPQASQAAFLKSFETKFGLPADYFTLNNLYPADRIPNHWLAYDATDAISPYPYLKEFLVEHPNIRTNNYEGTGHDKAIKSPVIIAGLVGVVQEALGIVG